MKKKLLKVSNLTPKRCVNAGKKSVIRGLYLQLGTDLVLPSEVEAPVELAVMDELSLCLVVAILSLITEQTRQ